MSTTTSRTSTRALALAGALVLAGTAFITAPDAHAAGTVTGAATSTSTTAATSTTTATPTVTPPLTKQQRAVLRGKKAVSIAATRKGSPYSYGGDGPRRFDCSGLTRWTFKKLGRSLPHSSSAQYGRTKHIRKSDRRLGDLVFFHDGGGIYHVAIYAGRGKVWHAPYSGTRVRKERIWTGSVYYGRVR